MVLLCTRLETVAETFTPEALNACEVLRAFPEEYSHPLDSSQVDILGLGGDFVHLFKFLETKLISSFCSEGWLLQGIFPQFSGILIFHKIQSQALLHEEQ